LPAFSIAGISYFMHNHTALRLTAIVSSHPFSSISATGVSVGLVIPALLNAQSSRPNLSTVCATIASISALLLTCRVAQWRDGGLLLKTAALDETIADH